MSVDDDPAELLGELLEELELDGELVLVELFAVDDDEQAAAATAATVSTANSGVDRFGQRDIGVSIWMWREGERAKAGVPRAQAGCAPQQRSGGFCVNRSFP